MMNKLISLLFPQPRSNLEVVLDKISKQREVKSARIAMNMKGKVEPLNIEKDLNLMVGRVSTFSRPVFKFFWVQFETGDSKCVIRDDNGPVPLFAFDDPDEVKQIREAVVSKYKETI